MRKKNYLLFDTATGRYLFDSGTSMIFAVDDILLDVIESFNDFDDKIQLKEILLEKYGNEKKIDSAIKFIIDCSKIKESLWLEESVRTEKLEKAQKFDCSIIKSVQESGDLWQLILNVTENCNMRCKYCYLSEEYEFTRNRTSHMMDFQTAKKALDLFFDKQRIIKQQNPGKAVGISFYGGEPLLNLDLIKRCVEYTKNNCPLKFGFYITTNGTLLKDDVVDYLVDNNFNIFISLDGNKDEHDKNRVDANGKGTYDRIAKNIERLVERYPAYLYKVGILGVHDWQTNLVENANYFEKNNSIRVMLLSAVLANNTHYYERFSEDDRKKFADNYLSLLIDYTRKKIDGKTPSSYTCSMFDPQIYSVLGRLGNYEGRFPFLPYTSACVPGSKMSVRVDGKIDVCEKINYSFPIGDVNDGFDYEKMMEMMQQYNSEIGEKCKVCPISKYCPTCYANCSGEHEFKADRCNDIIMNFVDALSITITILENNATALDSFDFKEEWLING